MTAKMPRRRAAEKRYRSLRMSLGHGDCSDLSRKSNTLRTLEANHFRRFFREGLGRHSSISTTGTLNPLTSGSILSLLSLPIFPCQLEREAVAQQGCSATALRRGTFARSLGVGAQPRKGERNSRQNRLGETNTSHQSLTGDTRPLYVRHRSANALGSSWIIWKMLRFSKAFRGALRRA
jgi:hypothetical protein